MTFGMLTLKLVARFEILKCATEGTWLWGGKMFFQGLVKTLRQYCEDSRKRLREYGLGVGKCASRGLLRH